MKQTLIIIAFVVAVRALPFQQQPNRHIREAAEPKSHYLPLAEQLKAQAPLNESATTSQAPAEAVNDTEIVEAATEAVAPESAALSENGYQYRKVVRKIVRLRQRRDVSHLNTGYLPPKPAVNYFPPHLDVPQMMTPQAKVSNEYLPPAVHISQEYLPPPKNEQIVLKAQTTTEAVATEAPETEAPTTEASTTTITEAAITEAPTTQVATTEAATTEAPTTQAATTEASTITITTAEPILKQATHAETAIFAEDGYHYRRPAVIPDLGMPKVAAPAEPEPATEEAIVVEPELAYLPPLEAGVVEAEGPGEATSALLDDGYHYRVIKRI